MKPAALAPVVLTAKEAVGNRRPPVATRFRPGQSGNPRGRSKTSSRLRALVMNEHADEIASPSSMPR
jgi:hypothetical protein